MKKTIEEFKNQKNELNSIIVYSIVLGISINIISSILSEMFDIQLWLSLIIWMSISLSVIVVSQIIKLYRLKTSIKKIKEIIDTKSSFADWLNNQIVRDQLKFDIKVCLIKNGYPPQYSPEVFRKVMEQVENFEENN